MKLLAASALGFSMLVVAAAGQARAQAEDQGPAIGTIPWYQRHAVFRPALNLPTRKPLMETGYEFPTRPLFLKGYAGHNYGRGPREVFIPTGYGTGIIQPVGIGAPVPCDPHCGRRRLRP